MATGFPPNYIVGSNKPYWFNYITPNYIQLETMKKICLDMPPAKGRDLGYWTIGYGMADPRWPPNGSGQKSHARRTTILNPSSSIHLGDSCTNTDYLPTYYWASYRGYLIGPSMLHYRHPGYTANIAWVDGHVKPVTSLEQKDSNNINVYWGMWDNGVYVP